MWKDLMSEIIGKLDLKGQSSGDDFVTYVDSLGQLKIALSKINIVSV